ncbi:probable aminopeptidase NPEPL1 [Coccinella septempunctata]|uniref:probable aminopeptidase NPEPL1 n=1 Tax=Coccinella septempunctata TaxID=41139 RepID=UPI001D064D8D|nr:probable aminopeptidase NPEPL1 [Coccinella septempunctata]
MVKVVFKPTISKSDPRKNPVLIIGQLKHLKLLKFDDIKYKLEPRVSEEVYKTALSGLHSSLSDSVSLYLNYASIASLPSKCSRHNTTARSHAVTRMVQSLASGTDLGLDEYVVIVCEGRDFYASAVAVARAYPSYNKKSNTAKNITVYVEFMIVSEKAGAAEGYLDEPTIQLLSDTCYALKMCQRIVDTPCCYMNIDHFISEAQTVAYSLKTGIEVIRGEELNQRGFGGIYGVGKGASCPPALVILKNTPATATKTIAWVGKGIVYDTGGLSLKGRFDMLGMKRDCGGAAAILGAFYIAVKSEFSENLYAVFCLAENAIGPEAVKPDDIITLYSGKTVEINNTDAEGRLVLADGVAYANKDLKADIIVDVATLTGAQGIATGKYHASILTNDEVWENNVRQAGQACGDLVHPVPFTPELHFAEFNSTMADMKNSVKDRCNAQVSCAGLFILSHLGFEYPGKWIHIDMAYTVASLEKATGFGVTLLPTLFGKYTNQRVLKNISPDMEVEQTNGAKRHKID